MASTRPTASGFGAPSATRSEIVVSTSSGSFRPSAPKSLIPLSRHGLWEAETTAARSRPWRRTRTDAAGGGSPPASHASPPPSATPPPPPPGPPARQPGLEHRAGVASVADDEDLRALAPGSGRGRGRV